MSDWYYAADNEQKGPINESELKADLATNKIPGDTLVWKEGMDAWTPANQVAAFSFRPPPVPAKVQPTAAPTPVAASAVAATPAAKTVAKAHAAVDNPDSTKPVDFKGMIGKPEALEVDKEDAETNKVSGILAYLGILFIIPLLNAKESPFCRYHANQGLSLFLSIIAAFIVMGIAVHIPFVGLLFLWLYIPLYLVILGMMILGILNAANGKCLPLPVIGGFKIIGNKPPEDQPPA